MSTVKWDSTYRSLFGALSPDAIAGWDEELGVAFGPGFTGEEAHGAVKKALRKIKPAWMGKFGPTADDVIKVIKETRKSEPSASDQGCAWCEWSGWIHWWCDSEPKTIEDFQTDYVCIPCTCGKGVQAMQRAVETGAWQGSGSSGMVNRRAAVDQVRRKVKAEEAFAKTLKRPVSSARAGVADVGDKWRA